MKAILEFDLNDPDDREEHRMALAGRDAHFLLDEISQQLFRQIHKYETHPNPKIQKALKNNDLLGLVYEMKGEFWEMVNEAGVNI